MIHEILIAFIIVILICGLRVFRLLSEYIKLYLIMIFFFSSTNLFSYEQNQNELILMGEKEESIFINALDDAIKLHPNYLQISSQLLQSKEMINVARSADRLQIKLEVNSRNSIQRQFENSQSTQIERARDTHRSDGSIIIEKSIYDQSIKKAITKQEILNLSDLKEKEQDISELIFSMVMSCQKTAIFSMIVNSMNSSVIAHKELYDKIESKVKSGRSASSDLSIAKARLAEINAKKMAMALQLKSAISQFNQLLPKTKPCNKMLPINLNSSILDKKELLKEIKNNFSLQSADLIIDYEKEGLEQIKAELKPTIKAQLRGDRYDLSGKNNYDIYAGINFNFDIYTGGKKTSMIFIANEKVNEAIYKRDILTKELTYKIEENFEELVSAKARIDAFNSAYNAYKESRNILKLQFDLSNASLIQILQAERDYLDATELLLLNHKSVLSSKLMQLLLLGKVTNYIEIIKLKNE